MNLTTTFLLFADSYPLAIIVIALVSTKQFCRVKERIKTKKKERKKERSLITYPLLSPAITSARNKKYGN